jgi:MFS family permease
MYMQGFSTLPLYLGELGIGPATYGKVIALNGLMIVFLQLPTTSIVTRFHRGTMVTLSAIVTAIGFGLMGMAATAGQFAIVVAVWTCGEMMNAPLMSAIVAELAPVGLRARYMGVFSMGFSAALIVGAPLGGAVLEHFGGAYLWGGSAVAGLAAALLYGCVHNRVAPRQEGV